MFDWLKNLFTALRSSGNSVIGVDVGSAYLKLVQLRRKGGKAVLETYGSLALGPYAGVEIGRATHLPAEKLAEALRDLIREAHATSTRAAFAIPFSSSLVTAMDMRVLDQKELATMVSLEARKYIPVPISEVNLEWWVIPEEPERISGYGTEMGRPGVIPGAEVRMDAPSTLGNANESLAADTFASLPANLSLPEDGAQVPKNLKILIAAIHNEALSRYGEVVKGSGLESSFFEIELFSAIRSLFPQELGPHAVLDLGAGETKLYVIDRGIIRLSHIISHGGQDITLALSRALGIGAEEAEKMKRAKGLQNGGREENAAQSAILSAIFSETNRTLSIFERKFGRKVDDVVLSGGGANLRGIAALAQQSFAVPTLRADPFKQVEAPAFLEEVLSSVGPEFTVAIGIAFRKLQEGS